MMHMLVIRILIKIKLDYGENCLKCLLNDAHVSYSDFD
jgi:hypothetical protein